VSEQRRYVTRLVRRFGVPAADVEDAAQDVFLISYRRQIGLDGVDDSAGWFFVAARYVCLNRRRSLRREAARRCFVRADAEAESVPGGLAPDEWLASRQLCGLLEGALARLKPEQQSVLVSSVLEDRTATEIASEQRAPVATIASRLRVGRQALRRDLHRHGWPVYPTAAVGPTRGSD
jgi:RNA polymerase sigma-70 factor, ECF subfamily